MSWILRNELSVGDDDIRVDYDSEADIIAVYLWSDFFKDWLKISWDALAFDRKEKLHDLVLEDIKLRQSRKGWE